MCEKRRVLKIFLLRFEIFLTSQFCDNVTGLTHYCKINVASASATAHTCIFVGSAVLAYGYLFLEFNGDYNGLRCYYIIWINSSI